MRPECLAATMQKSRLLLLIAVAIAVTLAALMLTRQRSAGAGEIASFDAQLRAAYADYRMALMQSNLKNREATDKAMTGFESKWTALLARYRKTPPPQFADDPDFENSVAAIDGILARAKAEFARGDLAAGHDTIEAVRDRIDAMEIRNGRTGFSQRMNAFHHAMEEILQKSYGGLAGAGLTDAIEDGAVLAHLTKELNRLPPPDAAAAPDFKPMLAALADAVGQYQAALRSGEAAAIKTARGRIKPAYARLFVKFG